MGLKATLIKPFAKRIAAGVRKDAGDALRLQAETLQRLVHTAANTVFGQEHGFASIRNPADFARAVPVRDYEMLRPRVEQIIAGGQDILWPGRPEYFAKTSGTTSGAKYIPLTRQSLPNHMNTARNALFMYVAAGGSAKVFDGKMIFLSGSPELEDTAGIKTGRLSGIVNHHIPSYVKKNQLPTYATNCIDDWETKLGKIVDETLGARMTLISGIPPWVLMYYERIRERTGKAVGEVFPHFDVFVYGGVNFEPYREQLDAMVGRPLATIETYPASEGFIAFQDTQTEPGMLLNINSGIYFEFIPVEEYFDEHPRRLTLEEVQEGVQYAVILSNNAGLWAYDIGDTVRFVSLNPWRVVVTGRVKHFISAFGEHVIAEEVEKAMLQVCERHGLQVIEFTVAPEVNPSEGLPYHEWFVEFAEEPSDVSQLALDLDHALRQQNSYYDDLLTGSVLQPLKLRMMPRSGFRDYMKSMGKLGGQNKVPRLANDRKLADSLVQMFF